MKVARQLLSPQELRVPPSVFVRLVLMPSHYPDLYQPFLHNATYYVHINYIRSSALQMFLTKIECPFKGPAELDCKHACRRRP
uniref:UBC core domain-containing protein n=1 Tax=Steinernema glaseri TaxID=37863 RepID=A0A1I7Y4X2_9BILA